MGGGTAGGEWHLGVDLGTTYTAAAVRRGDHSEIVTLGTRTAVEPTVVVATDDGLVVGEAAERRAGAAPERTVRQFKRRLGDPAPMLLGGVPYSPQALLAAVLADVVERTTVEQGSPPARVAITHPANWGPYKRELVRQVAELAGLEPAQVRTITEPAAAAIHYAAQTGLEPGSVVGVYDLGGGTFDAAVIRVEAAGAELLGEPTGIEHLGGIDVDAAVFGHVREQLGGRFDVLEGAEHAGLLARLRDECVRAKEALSTDADTVIGVPLPDGYVEVRLTRAELEAMIRPALAPTADALRRAISSAGFEPGDLAGVLLVGGSSRIPLVSELVSGALGRPVLLDAHPKHAVALGAAAYAAGDRVDDGAVPIVGDTGEVAALAVAGGAPGRRRRRVAAAIVAVAILLMGGVAAAQLGSDDPNDEVALEPDDETTTESSASTGSTGSTTSTETTQTTEGTSTTGGGGNDPGTTVAPTPTTTPRATTTTAAPVVLPGMPQSVVAQNPSGGSNAVRVTLVWSAPSSGGTPTGYVVRGTQHRRTFDDGNCVGSFVQTVFATQAVGPGTSTLSPAAPTAAACQFILWEVAATNSAGQSPFAPARGRLPAVSEANGFQEVRAVGGLTVGTPLACAPCTSPPASTMIDAGATVSVDTSP